MWGGKEKNEWRKDARRDRDKCTTTVVYTMSVTTVSPACTTQGYINHVCSHCGASYATDYTAALGHNYQYSYTQAPDYGVEGYDWYACTRCGAGYKDNVNPALRPSGSDAISTINDYISSLGYTVAGGYDSMIGYYGSDLNEIIFSGVCVCQCDSCPNDQ